MKKLISGLAIASILFTAIPAKKAEAGVVIAIAGWATAEALNSRGLNLKVINVVEAGGVGIGMLVAFTGAFWFASPALFVLGTDGSVNQNDLETGLAENYPFIQDQEVISGIASLIVNKVKNQKMIDGKIEVNISRNELMPAFAGTDIPEVYSEEFERLVNDLK